MGFNSETAQKAGQNSKRGKAKLTTTMRTFLFDILHENKDKFRKELNDLSAKEFIQVYLKLIPFLLATRHNQVFEISEISSREIREEIKNIIDEDRKIC